MTQRVNEYPFNVIPVEICCNNQSIPTITSNMVRSSFKRYISSFTTDLGFFPIITLVGIFGA